ncbi:hypothetical protein MKX01_017772 [Papaver californicum]|nr:hypothetical protein MKX01_017772 [Papaver californicum]
MYTLLFNLLLLLVFSYFSCFLVLVPVSAEVFLSIDCGSSSLKSFTDDNSIVWVGDGPYVQAGETHKVAPPNVTGWDSRVMSTLRAFPTRKKNCYSIDIDSETKGSNTTVERVLVRANFYYGNYDNKSNPPSFSFQFNGNDWGLLQTTEGIVYIEVVYSLNNGNNINVCPAQTQPDNIPFISALEIRSLDSNAYNYFGSEYPVFFLRREAFGTNKTIRYPEDKFDRVWGSIGPLDNTSILTRVTSNSPSINVTTSMDKPPEAVLRTTLTSLNSSENMVYSDILGVNVPIHINAYFSEVIKLNSTQKRSFDIIVNNNLDNSIIFPKNPVIPPYGRALEVHIFNMTTFNSSFSINFSFIQLRSWNGDPCLPSPFNWDWVSCDDDTDSPRITALNLNDLGLTGSLPDFSAMDALKTINLSNNSLTQEIPKFLGTFPELIVLNLADNSFFGTLPSSTSNNVNLKFTATGNPNLSCTPTSICNTDPESSNGNSTDTKPRIPTPVDKGRSSKTLVQPLIILLIIFSGLLL